jgi:hypothetical protein
MRRTHFTILLVCEGYAEDEFACVIRDAYLPRNCGVSLQRRNARGNSGARALDLAIESKPHTEHDVYAVMVDTDVDRGDEQRTRAGQQRIVVLENIPCLEATLLQVDGQRPSRPGRDPKSLFAERYGGPAHRKDVIRRHFPREKFDTARGNIAVIGQFLELIRC